MSTIKGLLAWIFGKALLYLALVAAILLAPWAVSEWRRPDGLRAVAARAEALKTDLGAVVQTAQNQTLAEIDSELDRTRRTRAAALEAKRRAGGGLLAIVRGGPGAAVANARRDVEIGYLDQKIAALSAVRETVAQRELLNRQDALIDRRRREALALWPACRAAADDLRAFRARVEVRATFELYDRPQLYDLEGKRSYHCDRWRAADEARLRLTRDKALIETRARQVSAQAEARIAAASAALDTVSANTRAAIGGTLRQRAEVLVRDAAVSAAFKQALALLLLIVLSPLLVRLFCYFVLAPLVMRRPAVRLGRRLARDAAQTVVALPERSSTSVAVRLAPGEELLVRQGYLQTTSASGAKSTKWLLDGRHPLSSLAAGLSFLTRIRGEGEVTTISATRDPFAEVTVLTLPEGAVCVLQPRALAAVVQPIGERLRITSHWRLFSLNAWLTLQLRYLAFHGPVRLVLQGSRGIRVERAERGRILGQDQVVGFSADLAYSVTRNETFWPYMLGREPLLRDRVAPGAGVLVIEEAPMAGRGSGRPRRGIEGAIDVVQKMFGL